MNDPIATYLRGTPDHTLSGVRAGVADVLEGKSRRRLLDELRAVYGLPLAMPFLDAMTRAWRAPGGDPGLDEAGRVLEEARAALWDHELEGLE